MRRAADFGTNPIDERPVLTHHDCRTDSIDWNRRNHSLRLGSPGQGYFEKQKREVRFDRKCRLPEEIRVEGRGQCQNGICRRSLQRPEYFRVRVSFAVERRHDPLALPQHKCMFLGPRWFEKSGTVTPTAKATSSTMPKEDRGGKSMPRRIVADTAAVSANTAMMRTSGVVRKAVPPARTATAA